MSAKSNTPLQISINTYGWLDDILGGKGKADEAFDFIRECGFEGIDYNFERLLTPEAIRRGALDSVYDLSLDELLQRFAPLKEAAEKHGVSIVQGHGIYPLRVNGSEEFDGRVILTTQKILEVCKYLNCPVLVLHMERPWGWEKNMEFLRKLIPAGISTGVKICPENLFILKEDGAEAFCDPVSACEYVDMLNEEAGAQVFGFCYDIGHANLCGLNLYEDITALGHRLSALHIHDNDGKSDQHLIPFTQKVPWKKNNCTDWEGVIAGLRSIEYKGAISFETHCALTDTPKELVPDVLRFIAGIGRYFKGRIEE
ncbi:MAG: sugar phosphate isomerase/epimerase [Clostridia bacterium]|nr:sugar phosphate isomerase/epimerase [Clostridia bacterium]